MQKNFNTPAAGLRALLRVCRIYWAAHGRLPNLIAPRRYTDKIQWRKLFDHNPAFAIFCDKLAVRDFIAARVGEAHLVPLLWAGDAENLPLHLPPPFVLKSTHACGHVIKINNAGDIDAAAIRTQAANWLSCSYGAEIYEPAYFNVQRRLMIEKMICGDSSEAPDEQRLFVFAGKVAVINTVFTENGALRHAAFHTADWQRLDWYFTRKVDRPSPAPKTLPDMIRIAEMLGEGLDHVRIDFFDCGEQFWVGEITVYSWSGLARFQPDQADFLLGAYWRLPSQSKVL